jgi:hypothetical protein
MARTPNPSTAIRESKEDVSKLTTAAALAFAEGEAVAPAPVVATGFVSTDPLVVGDAEEPEEDFARVVALGAEETEVVVAPEVVVRVEVALEEEPEADAEAPAITEVDADAEFARVSVATGIETVALVEIEICFAQVSKVPGRNLWQLVGVTKTYLDSKTSRRRDRVRLHAKQALETYLPRKTAEVTGRKARLKCRVPHNPGAIRTQRILLQSRETVGVSCSRTARLYRIAGVSATCSTLKLSGIDGAVPAITTVSDLGWRGGSDKDETTCCASAA